MNQPSSVHAPSDVLAETRALLHDPPEGAPALEDEAPAPPEATAPVAVSEGTTGRLTM